ncbi:MAG: HD domain-containing protein [Thermodesulfovibrionales bacterium]|nr:HD domain-containing protein [Thermodesulfovibrionales bacterium]
MADLSALHNNEKARLYIEMADKYLEVIGYTEHGLRHTDIVSKAAYNILKKLSFSESEAELAAAAGFLHDIGNMLGRSNHHKMGAILAKEVLEELGYDLRDIIRAIRAIGMHEEDEGVIPDAIAAALMLADKADVHRSRVRNPDMVKEDIHDRVNYAATESELSIDADKKLIMLSLVIDTRISQVIEYFEIFLSRMAACRKAAMVLNCEFQLYINNTRMA